jgi:hypothetical protein
VVVKRKIFLLLAIESRASSPAVTDRANLVWHIFFLFMNPGYGVLRLSGSSSASFPHMV